MKAALVTYYVTHISNAPHFDRRYPIKKAQIIVHSSERKVRAQNILVF